MSPSRKYSLVAIVLSAVMSLQVSAHNHAGEKPTKDPVNVVAMTLPIKGNFIKHYPNGSDVQLLLQPEDLEHDDQSNLKLEVVDRKFRGTNFIYTLKTNSNLLIPVFVHSHHIHQHEVDEKFGIKRPINIDHIVCF